MTGSRQSQAIETGDVSCSQAPPGRSASYDAVVVGASLAGCTTATLIARAEATFASLKPPQRTELARAQATRLHLERGQPSEQRVRSAPRVHAPNERFHLPNFYRGIESIITFFEELGK